MTDLTPRSEPPCHGGEQGFSEHRTLACAGPGLALVACETSAYAS
jgi:hypothetical protein